MRIPLFIALGVAIIGIVLGSFLDFQLSSKIATVPNYFGLTISAIGPTIGFAGVAVMGGGFVALALKGQYHVGLKVLFYVLAAACLGVAIYYPYGEYFGINGFYWVAPKWVGLAIVILPEIAAMVGGYFLFKNCCDNKNMWIVFCIIVALLLIALLGFVPVLKDSVVHRPRYRLLISNAEIQYHRWWEPTKEFKDLIEAYGIAKDDFKSFPSGHTAEASILFVVATFFPLASKKLEKYQLPAFIGASCLVLLVAFARIMAGAHFLSDVSFGATIILALTVIANEVIIRVKALHVEEAQEKPVQEAEKEEEKVQEEVQEEPAEEKTEEKPTEEKKAAPAKKPAPKKEEAKDAPKKNTASYHLSKRASDNKWQVFRAGSDKVIKLFDTKAEAEEYTKRMAENQGVSYLSHASKGKNKGRIQKK